MVAHEGKPRISENMWHAMEQPAEMVKEYPVSSMLLAFGVGLGVGVILAQACAGPMMSYLQPEPSMTEKLSRQIYEAVARVVPESLSRPFHT
jgi:uncharacterized protein YneF (UPF0154 family)